MVYESALEQAYKVVDKATVSSAATTGINLGSGLIAGIAAALVSQPADTILSKINKEKGETGEGTLRRVWRIAKDTGLRGSFAGTRARMVMVGGMTAVQFGIYGDINSVCSLLLLHPRMLEGSKLTMTIGPWSDRRNRDR